MLLWGKTCMAINKYLAVGIYYINVLRHTEFSDVLLYNL